MRHTYLMKRAACAAACIAAAAAFSAYAGRAGGAAGADGPERLEASVRRAAVACYSTEGCYPPDLQYLVDHYGLRPDGRYVVHYSVFAENVPPEITVTWR